MRGYTLFIEDDEEWSKKIQHEYPALNVLFHNYNTEQREWKKLINRPDGLLMKLPDNVWERQWDVILVDAPAGYEPELPGRMQSIYTARQLASIGTDVFVHDIDREIELSYCNRFFSFKDHVIDVQRLRHYRIST